MLISGGVWTPKTPPLATPVVTAHSPTLLLLHLHCSSFSNPSFASPMSQALLILQPFHHFTYIITHSPTLLSLYLCHSSFSNPSVASPTSQFIIQPFFRFSYVTSSSLNSAGEPPMIKKCMVTNIEVRNYLNQFKKLGIISKFCNLLQLFP